MRSNFENCIQTIIVNRHTKIGQWLLISSTTISKLGCLRKISYLFYGGLIELKGGYDSLIILLFLCNESLISDRVEYWMKYKLMGFLSIIYLNLLTKFTKCENILTLRPYVLFYIKIIHSNLKYQMGMRIYIMMIE